MKQLEEYESKLFSSGTQQRRSVDNYVKNERELQNSRKSDLYESQKRSYMSSSIYSKQGGGYLRESYLNTLNAN